MNKGRSMPYESRLQRWRWFVVSLCLYLDGSASIRRFIVSTFVDEDEVPS